MLFNRLDSTRQSRLYTIHCISKHAVTVLSVRSVMNEHDDERICAWSRTQWERERTELHRSCISQLRPRYYN